MVQASMWRVQSAPHWTAGPGAVFVLNAVSFLAIIWGIYRWQRPMSETQAVPEPVVSAIQAGGRYTRHARELRAVLVRTAASIAATMALWALLPVIDRQELKLGALGYGVLLGGIGAGAVVGLPVLSRLRASFSLDWIVSAMTIVFALTTLALGYVHNLWLLNAAMVLTGVAWLVLTSCLNVATQTIVPDWVEARALGVYLLVFQGCFAAGSAGWGALASRVGNGRALLYAAVALAGGTVTTLRWHLRTGEDLDLSPSAHIPPPETVVESAPEDGPVQVRIEYRIRDREGDSFVAAREEVRLIRLRDGAFRWGLFCDPADPGRHVETYEVASWAEHLRQHERATVVDRETESRALSYQEQGKSPVVEHLVSAQSMSSSVSKTG